MLHYNLQLFGGRGSAASRGATPEYVSKYTEEIQKMSKEELKEAWKSLFEESNSLVEKNPDGFDIGSSDLKKFLELTQKRDEVRYELDSKYLSPFIKPEKFNELNTNKGIKQTELTPEEAVIARQDLLRNKNIYMAVASARTGVFDDSRNTALDDMYEGTNGQRLYDNFKATREMLRKRYGDYVTLYRAGSDQTPKATINMTTSKANASQYGKEYGTKVMSAKVPVENILLVNLNRTGQYEEVVALNKDKNLNKKRRK